MQAGDLIANRYRLERMLGEGGMGSVWAATHTVTERTHALKLLRKKDDDPATRKRMLREARAASAVRHPNVATVHDVIEGPDGTPVLVMDLLEGESLGDRLERVRRLDVSEALGIVRAMLEALCAAHAAGVVHRDLKPDNVFLTSDGVKILDFGVAKLTAKDGPARATANLVTESGAMLGTPCYMAPEQAFGEGEIDARADLWAVGVVLYECLAGVRPADGATLGQVLKVLATGAIIPLEQRVPDLAGDVAAFVGKLMTIDREGRPASARVALDALDAMEGVAARSLVTPAPRTERRSPRVVAIAAAAGLALLAAAAAALAVLPEKEPVATTAPLAIEQPPAAPPPAVVAPAVTNEDPAPPAPPKPTAQRMTKRPAPAAASARAPSPASDSKLLTDLPF